ncbi:MAG TPA: LysM peptidoglycan-binding domain-containing protein [Actinomycetota bacterium]|nr:LysM peptidoglycan-binding domain-containing protein [Actinomycetota bacterium]
MGRTSVRSRSPRSRRGAVLLAAVVALAIPAGRALGASSADGGPGGAGRRAARVVVVRPGDTLWGIAAALVGPAGDPRPVVDAIARANGVDPGAIRPGQVLEIPAP